MRAGNHKKQTKGLKIQKMEDPENGQHP